MIDLSCYDATVFKDAIDTANLEHDSRFYHMWTLWKEYIDYYVVGNDHLKRASFFNLLGIILTYKGYGFEKSEQKISTRIHTFFFQRARSGKGEVMKAKNRLVVFLGIPSRYTMKDNVPSCIGTVKLPDNAKSINEKMSREGYLKDLFDYNWDEGSVLIRPSKDMDNVTDVFQGVMDEPGIVSKGLVWGSIEYSTNVSICAGSYIFGELENALMTKGFFQRMLLTYKVFTEENKAEMRRMVPLLKIRYNKGRTSMIMRRFRELCDEIPKPKNDLISFDSDSVLKFNNKYELIYNNIIKGQFVGRTQEVLESFGDMVHLLVDKISAQHAIIDGKDKVYYDDMRITLPIVKIHIASVLELFDSIEGNSITASMKRETIIMNIIRRYPNVANQKFILSKLDIEKKSGKWDIGRNKTHILIRKMVDDNKLLVENINGVKILVVPR